MGGFKETDTTVENTEKCVAGPKESVTCSYFQYEAEIKVGYTINWKNAPPTRGVYTAHGHVIDMIETIIYL